MSNKRFTTLIQIIVLLLASVVAIAQPVRGHTSSPSPDGVTTKFQISFVDFIFPRRKVRNRGSRNSSRGSFDESLPYVLTPRNTNLIAADELLLQWHPVAGASSYTVEITGRGLDWKIDDVTETEVVFDELASLEPDYRYTIVVTTDEGISSQSGESVGFTLLPEVERDLINAQVDGIKAEQLAPDEEALAIALEYFGFEHSDPDRRSYALNQDTIDVLESRIQAGTEDSRIYLLQADTYWRIGLPLLARERYEEALTYAQAARQPELQAESFWGLGDVAGGKTEYADAIMHLQAARAIYQDLGDFEQVEELQDRIEQLLMEIPPS